MLKVGIIGGSGIGDKFHISDATRVRVHTPYGATSDLVVTGRMNGVEIVALARHGAAHTIMPSMVNYRANIWAFKELGVTHILATTACGSLRDEIKLGQLVFIDQFIDRTTRRTHTFYEGMQVCHIPMAQPFCPNLRRILSETAAKLKIPHHDQGTIVTIEGPRFSSKAESKMFRLWGGDVIDMSTVSEAVLAREAGMCYASIAMSTDYDSWLETREAVSIDMVLNTMKANVGNIDRVLPEVLPLIREWDCECSSAFRSSFVQKDEA